MYAEDGIERVEKELKMKEERETRVQKEFG